MRINKCQYDEMDECETMTKHKLYASNFDISVIHVIYTCIPYMRR